MLGAQRVSAPPALHQRLLRGPALLGRAAGAELRGRGGLRGELAALHWLVRNKTSSAALTFLFVVLMPGSGKGGWIIFTPLCTCGLELLTGDTPVWVQQVLFQLSCFLLANENELSNTSLSVQQLLTGEMCCFDPGEAGDHWRHGQAGWKKKCCNNPTGHPVIQPERQLHKHQIEKVKNLKSKIIYIFLAS